MNFQLTESLGHGTVVDEKKVYLPLKNQEVP